MDEIKGLSIDSLLTEEESAALFEQAPGDGRAPEENENEHAEETAPTDEKGQSPEEVGNENEKVEVHEDAVPDGGGTSPERFYTSIAKALKEDGIFTDLDDERLESVRSNEDFGELFEEQVRARLDETQKRIYDALNDGVQPDSIKSYEQTISYLDGITDEMLGGEGDEAESLRTQVLYNDLVNRGYSQDRANREVRKSKTAGTDVEDAKDALESLRSFYKGAYQKVRDEARKRHDDSVEAQKRASADFRKMMLEDDNMLGDTVIDKKTMRKAYDAVNKPAYKDPDSGALLTEVQRFQKENPLEFLRQVGLWYVLTDGGRDLAGIAKGEARKARHEAIKDLQKKLAGSSVNPDGSLRLLNGEGGTGKDMLLDDGWKIG